MFGGRTTWRLFHAGDARVRAGPSCNLFLEGQSTGELLQTKAHGEDHYYHLPSKEARKAGSENGVVVR